MTVVSTAPSSRATSGRTTTFQHTSARHATSRRARLRDPFIDVVRAFGTLAVVVVHWLMAEAAWDGQTLTVGNALGHGGGWTVTWVLQALGLQFFAAGAAGAYDYARHGASTAPWRHVVGARIRGVLRPVGIFLGAWACALVVLLAAGMPSQAVWTMARMAPQMLWFLGVWVVLVAMIPLVVYAWRRWRMAALAVVVAVPLGVDLMRFGGGLDSVAWLNVLAAWAVPFMIGVAYAEHRTSVLADAEGRRVDAHAGMRVEHGELFGKRMRLVLVAVAAVAVMALAVMVTAGPYPLSMIGMPGDAISNLAPPTAPVIAQSIAHIAVVLACHAPLTRWAGGQGRGTVTWMGRHSMTIYIWHLTAMFVVVGVVLVGLGHALPEPWSTPWWLTRPAWFAGFAAVLTILVAVFSRFEVGRSASRMAGQRTGR